VTGKGINAQGRTLLDLAEGVGERTTRNHPADADDGAKALQEGPVEAVCDLKVISLAS
jgi:hypothetical protein